VKLRHQRSRLYEKPSATWVTEGRWGFDSFNHADQSRSHVPPQSHLSHVQFSQLQFSHDSPSQSHWQFSHVQLSPQQQVLATLSAETVLKPSNEAPATTAEAKSLDVTDMVKNSCEHGSRFS
jgi:hypothetical protein